MIAFPSSAESLGRVRPRDISARLVYKLGKAAVSHIANVLRNDGEHEVGHHVRGQGA
jgi:hypothetical protein